MILRRHLVTAVLLAAVAVGCGSSEKASESLGSTAAPTTTVAGATTVAATATTTAPSATTGPAPVSGSNKLAITASGAYTGSFSGGATFSGCGILGTNGYRFTATWKMNGHPLELRIGVNGKIVNGAIAPYQGPGTYQWNAGVEGHFEDQSSRVRWSEDLTGKPSGTVTVTSEKAGTFDLTMGSAQYKSDPVPAASSVHLVGSWSCG